VKDRAFRIHFARVMLTECSKRRHSHVNRDFYWTLFASAQKARLEAAIPHEAQGSLFA
jgi:hypothetical protein